MSLSGTLSILYRISSSISFSTLAPPPSPRVPVISCHIPNFRQKNKTEKTSSQATSFVRRVGNFSSLLSVPKEKNAPWSSREPLVCTKGRPLRRASKLNWTHFPPLPARAFRWRYNSTQSRHHNGSTARAPGLSPEDQRERQIKSHPTEAEGSLHQWVRMGDC